LKKKNNTENFKSLNPQVNNYTKFSVAKKIPSTEWKKQNTPEFSNHPEY
jgi:hypothetical protein